MKEDIKEVLSSSIMNEWLNDEYLEINKARSLKEIFSNNYPFRHLEINNFLKVNKANNLLEELKKKEFISEGDGGYSIGRVYSSTLLTTDIFKKFNDFLGSKEFISYIDFMTQLNITKGRGFYANLFKTNGFLPAHNDEQGGNKITFLLHLSNMGEGDGGNLNFCTSKGNNLYKVEKKIITRFNNLVFFELFDKSYHEVEKVIGNNPRFTLVFGFV